MSALRTPTWAYWLFSRPTLRALLGWDLRTRDVTWLRPTRGVVIEIGTGGGFYTRLPHALRFEQHDKPRPGAGPLAVVGFVLTVGGALMLARHGDLEPPTVTS